MASNVSLTMEYSSFRSTIPQKQVIVDDDDEKVWKLYDAGPKSIRTPLLFLPPVSGTADIFFKQLMCLSSRGYRVISLEHPIAWTVTEWCQSFLKLIDYLRLDKVHIFGASLGGFLALKFAEFTAFRPRVASLVLCNAFTDTTVFRQVDASKSFWVIPGFLLKKLIMGNFSTEIGDRDIVDSVVFMSERLNSLNQSDLASRLSLNCCDSYVKPQHVGGFPITVIDVFDECAISQPVRDEIYKCFPHAKRAHLKSGGNFPYLSRSEEVNLHLQIHMKVFLGSAESPMDTEDGSLSPRSLEEGSGEEESIETQRSHWLATQYGMGSR